MEAPLRNKVAESGIVNLDLEDFWPKDAALINLDLAPWLFESVILKEKDFRAFVADHSWEQYTDKHVAVYCSEDAIIPMWAYMLVAAQLKPFAKNAVQCTPEDLPLEAFKHNLKHHDWNGYKDQRVIVKGCSHKPIPANAYLEVASHLQANVKSMMFGEACSAVPIFKKK